MPASQSSAQVRKKRAMVRIARSAHPKGRWMGRLATAGVSGVVGSVVMGGIVAQSGW